MIEIFLRKLFTAQIMGILLAMAATQILVYGVTSVLSDSDSTVLVLAGVTATLIGLGLANRNSKPLQASAGIAALGLIGVWILGARLVAPLIELIQQIHVLIPQFIPALRNHTEIDTTGVRAVWQVITDASAALSLRFATWFTAVRVGARVNDVLIRNMFWAYSIWIIAAWMGWFSARRNAILAMLPTAVVLTLLSSYNDSHVEALWLLVVIMVLLMGIWNYKNHTHDWAVHKVDFSESIAYDNVLAVSMLAILIGGLAIATPSISWSELRDQWQSHSQSNDKVAESLGIQKQFASPVPPRVLEPTLPREHLLSGEVANSEKVVMTIRTGELPPIGELSFSMRVPHHYWRSAIYDQYMGTGWVTSRSATQRYSADTPLIPGLLENYKPLHLDIRTVEPTGGLIWSGMLFSVNTPATVRWRLKPTSDLFADQTTLLQADIFTASTPASNYLVQSYIPNVTVDQLRAASTQYPEDIQQHYLALPFELPQRVRDLAKQITAGSSNPYNKATAIEQYLRENYPYDLKIPEPPVDHDVADYFLFDLKRGYCDYYATAMVVLARAVGLPARFVSGYAPGEYEAADAVYIIRELNAHSWAEVYFPDIGWIEFEPTSSIPEITRDAVITTSSASDETLNSESRMMINLRFLQTHWLYIPLGLLLLAPWFYFALFEKYRYARLTPRSAIEKIYGRFYDHARTVAGLQPYKETALEFSVRLMDVIDARQTPSRIRLFSNPHRQSIITLTNYYNLALFSKNEFNKTDFESIWLAWKTIRWRLVMTRLAAWIKKQS